MTNKSCFYFVFLQYFLVLVISWRYFYSRNILDYIDLNTTNPAIFPEKFCEEDALLTIIVTSSLSNIKARRAIRDTWGRERNVSNSRVFLYFLLGEPLNQTLQGNINFESNQYGDIIQERFTDCYDNLTIKSVVMLKLFNHYCSNSTKYLFKSDDDMYVNLNYIVKMLENRNTTDNLLMGHLICKARAFRNYRNKWYSPRYMYKPANYPNFLSGTGYVMSADVAKKLYETAITTQIFHFEDVFLTGIVAKKSGIIPQNNLRFTYIKLNFDLCFFQKLSTIHFQTRFSIRTIYVVLNYLNSTKICTEQMFKEQWLMTNLTLENANYYDHRSC